MVLCAFLVGCKSFEGLPEIQGGIELGLRRGSAWSTLTVRPPYVIGPRVNLKLKRGEFNGIIDGRPVNLKMGADGIVGTGPAGQVSIDIIDGPDTMTIEGTWNASRVHFQITAEALRGSIAIAQARRLEDVFYCQYVLDRVEKDGSRAGISICGGLPEDTLLEIPRAIQGWLTRPELAVVLLALMSSPPFTTMERTSLGRYQ